MMKCALIALLLLSACAPESRSERRLVEWGWHTPDLQHVEPVLDAAQGLPFDGMVIDVETPLDGRGLSWTLFGPTPIDQGMLDTLAEDYQSLQWGRLTDNFLRLTAYPANVDWFDDWTTLEANMQAWARLAHDLGFVGVVFDVEQYDDAHLFEYSTQEGTDATSFEGYAQQAFERGQEVMDALEAGYPGLTVMYTYALTAQPYGNLGDPATQRYGLLIPFVEGMVTAADENTALVDGYEGSYIYRQAGQFQQVRDQVSHYSPLYTDPATWENRIRVGFGLWIDPACGRGGLPEEGCGFSREEFQSALTHALRYSDRYIWIYSHHTDWYTGDGIPGSWQTMMQAFQ